MECRLRIKRMDGCFEGLAMLTAGYSSAGQGKAAAVAKQISSTYRGVVCKCNFPKSRVITGLPPISAPR